MALYFYFNETTGDLVYSDQATYSGSGYTSLGQQTNTAPDSPSYWIFDSKRSRIKTVAKDPNISTRINILTSMRSMFTSCSSLTSLDLSGFDTSSVTSMDNMFSNCGSITSLDLSGFDTSSVTSMVSMFSSCSSLTSLDLSGFDTSSVTSMRNMFTSCGSLTSLDLSGFDTSNVTKMNSMFFLCSSLRIIDISPNMSNVLSQLPAATYYNAVTRQSYAKASIPGGSTYVRDLADLDLVATMVQLRAGIKAMEHRVNSHIDRLRKQLDSLTA